MRVDGWAFQQYWIPSNRLCSGYFRLYIPRLHAFRNGNIRNPMPTEKDIDVDVYPSHGTLRKSCRQNLHREISGTLA